MPLSHDFMLPAYGCLFLRHMRSRLYLVVPPGTIPRLSRAHARRRRQWRWRERMSRSRQIDDIKSARTGASPGIQYRHDELYISCASAGAAS